MGGAAPAMEVPASEPLNPESSWRSSQVKLKDPMESEPIGLLVHAVGRTGVLHQLTGVIAAHDGDITSVAILDALNTFDAPVIEVHISNVHKREEFRHHSFVSKRADGVIAGLGTQGYLLALRRVAKLIGG